MVNFFTEWGSVIGWGVLVVGICVFVYNLFFSDSEGRGKASGESSWQYARGTGVSFGLLLMAAGLLAVIFASR